MHDIVFMNSIYSTNVYAKANLDNLQHFKVISADLQTNGHGQFERVWYSSNKNGGNCYISIVLKPENTKNLDKLTRYTSLKVAQTLAKYDVSPMFKYPNDVLIKGKKIAGILAESVFFGEKLKGVVVGIGVNLNLNEEELKQIDIPATSIFFETQDKINKIEFIKCLLDNFKEDWEKFISDDIKGEILCYQPKL